MTQLAALLWKNWLTKKRRFKNTLREVVYPLILGLILVLLAKAASGANTNNSILVPLYVPLAFSQFLRYLLMDLVGEKHDKFKEMMKMMGLKNSIYWLSWFITEALLGMVIIVTFVGVLIGGGVLTVSAGFQLALLLALFVLTLVQFAFILSVFFSSPKVATQAGAIVFVLALGLYFPMHYWKIDAAGKTAACLLSPLALAMGAHRLNGDADSTDPSILAIFLMMLLDLVVYSFLGWYLDQVYPSEYGVAKHPFFLCKRQRPLFALDSFLNRINTPVNEPLIGAQAQAQAQAQDMSQFTSNREYPNEPLAPEAHSHVTISVRNLHKHFDSVMAVNGVSLQMVEGQIFCLLGQNGAGKTTTLNILTGLYPPSFGDAMVYGYSIAEEMDLIRHKLGVCAQQDVLFDTLTVEEHLVLYGKLKGVDPAVIQQQVSSVISHMNLTQATRQLSSTLSGGQKRKLSVAIALMGDSKFIVLDEPTAGLDPVSRREMWNILLHLRQHRTFVLTTHSMEEAEVLADRIGIMAHGTLACVGSPSFLKRHFGVGYQLSLSSTNTHAIEKANQILHELDLEVSSANDSTAVSTTAAGNTTNETSSDTDGYGPDGGLDNEETHLTISESIQPRGSPSRHNQSVTILPFSQIGQFATLFSKLESISDLEVGVSVNSLEDVFLKISLESNKQGGGDSATRAESGVGNRQHNGRRSQFTSESASVNTHSAHTRVRLSLAVPLHEQETTITGFSLFISQLRAVAYKRGMTLLRDYRTLFMFLIPTLFDVIGLFSLKSSYDSIAGPIMLSFWLAFGFAYLAPVFGEPIVFDKQHKLRHMMRVMGCKPIAYWTGHMLIDLIIFVVSVLFTFMFIAIIASEWLPPVGITVGLFAAFSVSLLMQTYALSFLFSDARAYFRWLPMLLMASILFFPGVLAFLGWLTKDTDSNVSVLTVQYIFCVFPLWGFFIGYAALTMPISDLQNYLPQPDYVILILAADILLYALLTLWLDARQGSLKPKGVVRIWDSLEDADDDVFRERERINSPGNSDAIKVLHLRKQYDANKLALRDLSLGVGLGEVFGLLGPNGAGKSTSLSIVTSQLQATAGSAILLGHDMRQSLAPAWGHVALCPQENVLWELLTVEDHLYFFGRMKGLNPAYLHRLVFSLLDRIQLRNFQTRRAGTLSGGNKRKLCVANALLGRPKAVFMDEPSTGLDPYSRRCVWDLILDAGLRAAIMLTTHSMEEAEALCSRLAIMVNGQLRCIGTPQHLKARYGSGYNITIKFNADAPTDFFTHAERFLKELFASTHKRSRSRTDEPPSVSDWHTWQISQTDFVLSKAFGELERSKSRLHIEEYTVTQSTIEQVFLDFARQQEEVPVVPVART